MGILFYGTFHGSRPQGEGLDGLTLPAVAQGHLGQPGSVSPELLPCPSQESPSARVKGLGNRAGQPRLGCCLCTYYLWHPEQIIKQLCASVFLAAKWGNNS